jgi:hypothetical protein
MLCSPCATKFITKFTTACNWTLPGATYIFTANLRSILLALHALQLRFKAQHCAYPSHVSNVFNLLCIALRYYLFWLRFIFVRSTPQWTLALSTLGPQFTVRFIILLLHPHEYWHLQVWVKSAVFWDVIPCYPAEVHRRFGGHHKSLPSGLKREQSHQTSRDKQDDPLLAVHYHQLIHEPENRSNASLCFHSLRRGTRLSCRCLQTIGGYKDTQSAG